MAKQKKIFPTKEDVPAWFMTYSDVITLLMTFFILLLTFATTEPERFDQVSSSISKTTSGRGLIGEPLRKKPEDSLIARVRPPAARIATRGATMPPITQAPARESFGKGLQELEEQDRQHNESTGHHFDIDFNQLFNSQQEISLLGESILKLLSNQLRDLPFAVSFQFQDPSMAPLVSKLMIHMTRQYATHPGQMCQTLVRTADLPSGKLRIVIRRQLAD